MPIIQLVGAFITLFGSIFLFLGALGVVRMPDSYNRIQAGTKATTLGAMGALLGIGLYHPSWFGKILLLLLFVMLTNPLSSHALARAAHVIKIPLARQTVVDKLEEFEEDVL